MILKYFVALLVSLLVCSANAQTAQRKWYVSGAYSFEKHDKRLYSYSERNTLLKLQPENWGTNRISVFLRKQVINGQYISLISGLGIEYSNATFRRPFQHKHFEPVSVDILRELTHYKKLRTPVNFTTSVRLSEHWVFDAEINILMLLYKQIDNVNIDEDPFPYDEFGFQLDAIELEPGLRFELNNFTIGFGARLVNYQKIDKIIFNSILNDPRGNKKWEFFNPLQINLVAGYIIR